MFLCLCKACSRPGRTLIRISSKSQGKQADENFSSAPLTSQPPPHFLHHSPMIRQREVQQGWFGMSRMRVEPKPVCKKPLLKRLRQSIRASCDQLRSPVRPLQRLTRDGTVEPVWGSYRQLLLDTLDGGLQRPGPASGFILYRLHCLQQRRHIGHHDLSHTRRKRGRGEREKLM